MLAKDRARTLRRWADLMIDHVDDLALLLTSEQGKPLAESRAEIVYAASFLEWFGEEAKRVYGDTIPSPWPDKRIVVTKEPVGVTGGITPWNFPMAIPAWKTLPALLAGNAVILKPASDTPLLALKLANLLHEAGLPGGVLNVITGPGVVLGDALVSHKGVNMISLTGSTEVGRHVAEICGRDLRRCTLELGGKNAVIVLEDADLDLAVESVSWGAFGTTGQRCTATSRVIVHKAIQHAFTDRLVAAAEKLQIGNGLDEKVDMGPLVNRGRVHAVHQYTQVGQQEGAKLLTGGTPLNNGDYSQGAFYKPTVFTDVSPDMRIAREEVFGPFVSILPVASYEEAVQVANATEYGLSTSIFTNDLRTTFRAMREIESGLIYFNAPTTGAEIHMPFGGVKASGNGHRELGTHAVEEFSETKSIFVSYPPKHK